MPGKGRKFTSKQDRQAKHITSSERSKGVDEKKAKAIGYATVNKQKSKKDKVVNVKRKGKTVVTVS